MAAGSCRVIDKEIAAKETINRLLLAGRTGALVEHYDGGRKVTVVYSNKNPENMMPMSLSEAEELMDDAIRQAWAFMTGKLLDEAVDPVEFINE